MVQISCVWKYILAEVKWDDRQCAMKWSHKQSCVKNFLANSLLFSLHPLHTNGLLGRKFVLRELFSREMKDMGDLAWLVSV